jgi:hypothetical protein
MGSRVPLRHDLKRSIIEEPATHASVTRKRHRVSRKKWSSWSAVGKAIAGIVTTAAALVGILVTVGLIASGDKGGGSLAEAATKTLDAGSSRFKTVVAVTTPSVEADETQDGVGDWRSGESQYNATIRKQAADPSGVLATLTFTTRVVATPSSCYTRLPTDALRVVEKLRQSHGTAFTGLSWRDKQKVAFLVQDYGDEFRKLTVTKPWIKSDVTAVATAPGSDVGALFGQIFTPVGSGLNDPSQLLAFLKTTAGLEDTGEEPLFGTQTTHYAGAIDLRDVPETVADPTRRPQVRGAVDAFIRLTGEAKIPTEVWVDDDDLVRQVGFGIPSGSQLNIDVTIDFFDYGVPARVKLPPAAQTLYVTRTTTC